MLTIRLQRIGKKNDVQFRIILAEKESHASKKFAEVLGSYNPHTKALQIKDDARLNYWVSQHVSLSPTVHNLLVTHKKLEAAKVKAFTTPKKAVEKAESAPASSTPVEAVVVESPAEPEVVPQEAPTAE